MLTPAEIHRLVGVLAVAGVRRVRLTGGEPLARRDCGRIIASIRAVPGISDIAITTNGQRLVERAAELGLAGLSRVNIHIDSLRRDRYRALTGHGELPDALRAVEAALRYDLGPVKINTVLMRGINDDEIEDFCRLAINSGATVRFIELMNTGPASAFVAQHFMSADAARAALTRTHHLRPRFADRGACPATEFDVDDGAGTIGFIASETQPFCGSCNRVRVTSQGLLKTCLYESGGLDLRSLLRDAAVSDDDIRQRITAALAGKRSHHPAFGHTGDEPFAMAQVGG